MIRKNFTGEFGQLWAIVAEAAEVAANYPEWKRSAELRKDVAREAEKGAE